jgi:hypothetical protein
MLRRRKTARIEVSLARGPLVAREAITISVEAPVRDERETALLIRWARDCAASDASLRGPEGPPGPQGAVGLGCDQLVEEIEVLRERIEEVGRDRNGA